MYTQVHVTQFLSDVREWKRAQPKLRNEFKNLQKLCEHVRKCRVLEVIGGHAKERKQVQQLTLGLDELIKTLSTSQADLQRGMKRQEQRDNGLKTLATRLTDLQEKTHEV